MLDFVRKAFRGGLEVILWVNLLLAAIVGAIAGYYLGQLISYNPGGYVFLGMIIGIACGLLTNIVVGGFIATLLNIDKNIELVKKNFVHSRDDIQDKNENIPIDEQINELKNSSTIGNNQLKIKRLQNTFGSSLLANVDIDNRTRFDLENGEEKVMDIQNGKHSICISVGLETIKQDFDINNNGKILSIYLKPLKVLDI
jgi:hypothetical protein